MNRKYFLISLGIHCALCLLIFTFGSPRENSPIVQIGVEINVSKLESHLETKTHQKKPKAMDTSITEATSIQKEEESSESVDEKASGRDQSLISQYSSQIAKLIDERKSYPLMAKKMKQEGEVILKITIGKEGNILNLEIEKPSNFASLNNASLDCVKKIRSFPPIPTELGVDKLTFSIPIEYKIL